MFYFHSFNFSLQHLVGKYALHPFCNRKLLIVGDEAVDPEFGTGMFFLNNTTTPLENLFERRARNFSEFFPRELHFFALIHNPVSPLNRQYQHGSDRGCSSPPNLGPLIFLDISSPSIKFIACLLISVVSNPAPNNQMILVRCLKYNIVKCHRQKFFENVISTA